MSARTQKLDRIYDLTRELNDELLDSDELEEITDILIEEVLDRIPFPRWLPFVKGYARKKLDAWLPGGFFRAIMEAVQLVRRKLIAGGNGGSGPLVGVLFLLLLPVAAACQTGRATVRVIDRSALVVVVMPPTYTGEVGDTLTFRAAAIDGPSGDTVAAVFQWQSTDPAGVSVDPSTGFATLLRAGTYDIEAMVVRIVAMMITRQNDDGTWSEVFTTGDASAARYAARGSVPDSLVLEVGQVVPLCAYLVGAAEEYFLPDSIVWSSADPSVASIAPGAQDVCPTWSPGLGWVSRARRIPVPSFLRASR